MTGCIPLRPRHLAQLRLQERQSYLGAQIRDPEMTDALIAAGPAYALLVADRPIAAAGVILDGYAMPTAWALLAAGETGHFIAVHRAVTRFFVNFRQPVQTGVEPGHAAGERWARLLGFARVGAWAEWQSAFGRRFERWVRHGA